MHDRQSFLFQSAELTPAEPVLKRKVMTSPLLSVPEKLDTHRKALAVNLDRKRYGTFAEIGAGQEVARWFFKVGGAAGTIAKTISAYDMTVSDAIYGRADRYVSRTRLQSMLDYEYRLTIDRLSEKRGDETCFFSFADTVATKGFKTTNEGQGWMGVKFQSQPHDDYSQIIIHVRMLDDDAQLQQEALGMVGVNLLYGAFFLHHEPEQLLESLHDGLNSNRLEVDMIEFSGIEFRHVDNRLMSLRLVQLGLSKAAMFGPTGAVLQPSEILYKKPILVERGSFRPVCNVNLDMLHAAYQVFSKETEVKDLPVVQLAELSMRNLLSGSTGEIDTRDFLARADLLCACGMTVLISDYFEYYRLRAYLNNYTKEEIGIVMGIPSLLDILNPKYYANLEGGILESFGRLFKSNVRLYIYPYQDPLSKEFLTIQNAPIDPALKKIYDFLVEQDYIRQLNNHNPECLPIFSRDILKRIKAKDSTWEKMVPPQVADLIKNRHYFGFEG